MQPPTPEGYHGIYPAIVCPLTADFRVDEQALADLVAGLAAVDGVVGVLCNGHAGENFLLDAAEQRRVVEVVAEAIGRRHVVVSGVNRESSLEAAELGREAERAGADALMVFAPNAFALGQDERMALTHHRLVVEATDGPIMLFQASRGAGRMAYPPAVLAELARLPRVVAIKEGSWEVNAYEINRTLIKRVAPDLAVMASGDEHLFTSFVIGSEGSIVSLATLIPETVVALDRAVRAGDMAKARAAHAVIQPLARAIYATPPGCYATARLKLALALLGRIPAARVCPPIAPLPAAEEDRLRAALAAAGLL